MRPEGLLATEGSCHCGGVSPSRDPVPWGPVLCSPAREEGVSRGQCQAAGTPFTPAARLCPMGYMTHASGVPNRRCMYRRALASPARSACNRCHAGTGGEQGRDGCWHGGTARRPGRWPRSANISGKATVSIPPGPRVPAAPATCRQPHPPPPAALSLPSN